VFRDPEQLREAEAIVDRLLAGTAPPPAPDPALTRDGYDVGNTNQLAVRAADVVIGEPGARYNPLVITGPAGVGKTHLLHAIGNALQARQELPLRVACVGAAKYSEELILALREDTLARWRARYRAADVLLFDDVHFLGGKERTQEELFHLLNVFRDLGKQVVLATEVPPRNLQRVEERIRTRLEEGLVVEIQPPDRLLRRKLVTRFFAQLGEDPDGEVVSLLADPVEATARELRQRVQRIHRTAREAGVAVSPAFVQGLADPVQDAPAIPAGSALPGADPFFLAGEKVVWEWPDLGGRMIEEFR
jgi:chromosomal replication initiator protein